jgi:endonuclease YncB( thermonuclease family)
MRRVWFVGLLVVFAFHSSSASDLIGRAAVVDGDTLEIHGTRIRLWGIDAPESDQLCRNDPVQYRCGQRSANELDAFIASHPVSCVEVDRDQYRRAVSVCSVAGADLADWLVRNGLALDWPQYSKGQYAAAQNEAKLARRGIWNGLFVEPWRYRACLRLGKGPSECSDDR